MTPAALGEMSAQMTTSVALLMNTTYICMDHSRRVVFYLLDRSLGLLIPLANVLLRKTIAIGIVSKVFVIDMAYLPSYSQCMNIDLSEKGKMVV